MKEYERIEGLQDSKKEERSSEKKKNGTDPLTLNVPGYGYHSVNVKKRKKSTKKCKRVQ